MTSDFEGFLSRNVSITFFVLSLFFRKPVFPNLMLSPKQGNYWFNFYNVFCNDAVLDWGLNQGPRSQHYTTRLQGGNTTECMCILCSMETRLAVIVNLNLLKINHFIVRIIPFIIITIIIDIKVDLCTVLVYILLLDVLDKMYNVLRDLRRTIVLYLYDG